MSGPTLYTSKGEELFTKENPAQVGGIEFDDKGIIGKLENLITVIESSNDKLDSVISKLDSNNGEVIGKLDQVIELLIPEPEPDPPEGEDE